MSWLGTFSDTTFLSGLNSFYRSFPSILPSNNNRTAVFIIAESFYGDEPVWWGRDNVWSGSGQYWRLYRGETYLNYQLDDQYYDTGQRSWCFPSGPLVWGDWVYFGYLDKTSKNVIIKRKSLIIGEENESAVTVATGSNTFSRYTYPEGKAVHYGSTAYFLTSSQGSYGSSSNLDYSVIELDLTSTPPNMGAEITSGTITATNNLYFNSQGIGRDSTTVFFSLSYSDGPSGGPYEDYMKRKSIPIGGGAESDLTTLSETSDGLSYGSIGHEGFCFYRNITPNPNEYTIQNSDLSSSWDLTSYAPTAIRFLHTSSWPHTVMCYGYTTSYIISLDSDTSVSTITSFGGINKDFNGAYDVYGPPYREYFFCEQTAGVFIPKVEVL